MDKKISNKSTVDFYNQLMAEGKKVTFYGKNTRFNVFKILQKKNIKKYFDQLVKKFISNNDLILDYGCGPGTFSIKLSRLTKNYVHSIDITKSFISECKNNSKKMKIKNIKPKLVKGNKLPFRNKMFDTIVIVDVIHHLENIDRNFKEIYRVLKDGGKIIIYEPNKLNPLIAITHFLEKNERGIFRVGTKKSYKKILNKFNMKQVYVNYSGIIIGPDSKILELISKILNVPLISVFFGWLNPKIVIVAKK